MMICITGNCCKSYSIKRLLSWVKQGSLSSELFTTNGAPMTDGQRMPTRRSILHVRRQSEEVLVSISVTGQPLFRVEGLPGKL